MKVQAVVISVDSGNLRFSRPNWMDIVNFNEILGATNLTNNQYFTVENQKEVFYLGGTKLTDDFEMDVLEVDGNATVFSIMLVPDNGRTISMDELQSLIVKGSMAKTFKQVGV